MSAQFLSIHTDRIRMPSTLFTALALAACVSTASAADTGAASSQASAPGKAAAEASEAEVEIPVNKDGAEAAAPTAEAASFCFVSAVPPIDIKYTVIKKLKVSKGTYGGVKDVLPKLADYALIAGADAIINYNGAQRFGFFPWRLVRPVVSGTAVKLADASKKDCAALGGSTLKEILATNVAPPR